MLVAGDMGLAEHEIGSGISRKGKEGDANCTPFQVAAFLHCLRLYFEPNVQANQRFGAGESQRQSSGSASC
jgi:hypothetical protein